MAEIRVKQEPLDNHLNQAFKHQHQEYQTATDQLTHNQYTRDISRIRPRLIQVNYRTRHHPQQPTTADEPKPSPEKITNSISNQTPITPPRVIYNIRTKICTLRENSRLTHLYVFHKNFLQTQQHSYQFNTLQREK